MSNHGKATDESQPPPTVTTSGTSSSTTSTSSFMSQFYTPINPSAFTPAPPQPTEAYQPPPTYSTTPDPAPTTQSLGANAALLLANLATMPGFLSETAIQEARQQYGSTQSQPGYTPYHPSSSQQQQHPLNYPLAPYQSDLTQHLGGANYPYTQPSAANAEASISDLLNKLKNTDPTQGAGSSSVSPSYSHSTSSAATPSTLTGKEDFSNGKITPQLLKRLAALAEKDASEGGKLWAELNRLKEQQQHTERKLYEDRQALLSQHSKDLVKLQARFDKNVVWEMDRLIQETQASLALAQIPMLHTTTDQAMIASQIKVIRLLEDMFQG
ncbi:MAG: hypothetical protein BYD32DRAFT_435722 [Podila humilis]|nr:MAG: hypothetical protein BYD32DRAFT_435722 [Podila humilis]